MTRLTIICPCPQCTTPQSYLRLSTELMASGSHARISETSKNLLCAVCITHVYGGIIGKVYKLVHNMYSVTWRLAAVDFFLPFIDILSASLNGTMMRLRVTHLSPFLSVMSVCRLAFMSRLRFSTMLLMQLSRARQRVCDWMGCRQMGHSSFFLRHCLMQWQQKLWAQFRMTACINAV